eukprot:TRINITY_DN8638_c0_g1_i1.p1 TRINITY_DN8638_c0_g1~~TRINITY_DN8638_c0_g1_i1.p1  ORF type:complete len:1154 (+),score=356.09 TRINITY_DN8638_c0_g1_i1:94-3555(+)
MAFPSLDIDVATGSVLKGLTGDKPVSPELCGGKMMGMKQMPNPLTSPMMSPSSSQAPSPHGMWKRGISGGKNHMPWTPMSEASTAPPQSPGLRFLRLTSAGTEFDFLDFERLPSLDESDDFEEAAEQEPEERVDPDGTTWQIWRGRVPTVDSLEKKLSDIKALYREKVGKEVDDEDVSDEEDEHKTRPLPDESHVDEDGTTWHAFRGKTPTFENLERMLSNVRMLYAQRTGEDVDEEVLVDRDGTTWRVYRGKTPTVDGLEKKLEEVKKLYQEKTGEDVDEKEPETRVDSDGTTWNVWRGKTPPSLEQLQRKLLAVKALYAWKVGQEVSEPDEEEPRTRVLPDETRVDADGTSWNVYRGQAPTIASLEKKLGEVKSLYQEKTGAIVDGSEETRVDADGTIWNGWRGRAPTMDGLEKKLQDLKNLYQEKVGEEISDDEDDEVERYPQPDETRVDADGTVWHAWRGQTPTLDSLEKKLNGVKSLYQEKTGEIVDGSEETRVDAEGTIWHAWRGKAPTMDALEQKLQALKSLYEDKVGEEISDDEDQGLERYPQPDETRVDADGMVWHAWRGQAPTMDGLERRLQEVKNLYQEKTGEIVDGSQEFRVDGDGTVWQAWRGKAPSMDSLEQKLKELKSLYEDKVGEEISDVEDDEPERYPQPDATRVDADGAVWHAWRGRAPTMDSLEKKLEEVKSLYEDTTGNDVDAPDEIRVDADGTTWNVWRGTTPNMEQLQRKLVELKALYAWKVGEEVDDDGDALERYPQPDATRVDADGAVWHAWRGRAPTMERLEQRLAEVKNTYQEKTGEIVDGSEDTCVDADGTSWNAWRGKAPSMDNLQKKLQDVKALFQEKVGEDFSDDEDELERYPQPDHTCVDADGALWHAWRGRAPTMESLEKKLEQVKDLYEEKTGNDVDAPDEVRVDTDGTTWNVWRGSTPSMEQLQRKLVELKALYAWKVGEEISDDDGCDDLERHPQPDEIHVDADGMVWHAWRGRAPTMESLERKLAEVKNIYQETTGEIVDGSEEMRVDSDGTTWKVYRGKAPSMDSLEKKLQELKALYQEKVGDDFSDDEDDEVERYPQPDETHVDADGAVWHAWRGRAPTMDSLEKKLQEVKNIYQETTGEIVDGSEEMRVDNDGTTWNVYRGKAPSMDSLEKFLR